MTLPHHGFNQHALPGPGDANGERSDQISFPKDAVDLLHHITWANPPKSPRVGGPPRGRGSTWTCAPVVGHMMQELTAMRATELRRENMLGLLP